MLSIEGLTVRYGPIVAVRDVSWSVDRGETVALLGPNGAGKTTTLSAVAGLLRPTAGRIVLDGVDITGWPAERVIRHGLVLTPEGRRIHAGLTVRENLVLGASFRRDRPGAAADLERMLERFPILGERREQAAGTLSGGEAQQLAIARSLMARPRVLLLDEPTLGLAPMMVELVFDVVRDLSATGLTIVLVDQNATRAMDVADRTYVMRSGSVVASGTAAEIGGPAGLTDAYLGGSGAAHGTGSERIA
ncbi:MAG: ABC transporter ATP-binding protein [Actinobacteria bacterium 69-20]|nr:ABC transporter ATP-binding protein [Actinomycetota bacterium]OJV30923.1 MAG: ABC transporter ATP-binding protein [Actinobacteria bacterium 69-20]